MDKDKGNLIIAVISAGVIIFLTGVCYGIVRGLDIISILLMNQGLVIAAIGGVRLYSSRKGIMKDERTRMLSARGLTYSWLITLLVINIMVLLDSFRIITMTLSQGLGIILFTQIASAAVSQGVLKKIGVIDENKD